MKFTDAIWVNAPPARVWEILNSPDVWMSQLYKSGKTVLVSSKKDAAGSSDDRESQMRSVTHMIDYDTENPNPGATTVRSCYILEDEGLRTKVTLIFEMADFNSLVAAVTRLIRNLDHRQFQNQCQ